MRGQFLLTFDTTRHIKSQPLRNHGRVVPYCSKSTLFGVNNNLQFIHMPMHYKNDRDCDNQGQLLPSLTCETNPKLSKLLWAAPFWSALDAVNSLHIINCIALATNSSAAKVQGTGNILCRQSYKTNAILGDRLDKFMTMT